MIAVTNHAQPTSIVPLNWLQRCGWAATSLACGLIALLSNCGDDSLLVGVGKVSTPDTLTAGEVAAADSGTVPRDISLNEPSPIEVEPAVDANVESAAPDSGPNAAEVDAQTDGATSDNLGAPESEPTVETSQTDGSGAENPLDTDDSCPSCPSGYSCFDAQVGAKPVCAPAAEFACASCKDDSTCLGGLCVGEEGGAFCRIPCAIGAGGSSCPPGFGCVFDTPSQKQLCTPTTGICSCTLATKGAAKACQVVNAVGTCAGLAKCGIAGWLPCNAVAAVAELCNASDDDCDGLTDEGTSGNPCTLTGIECVGATLCDPQNGVVCQVQGKPEVCDGSDNDCDGLTDEAISGQPCALASSANCQGLSVCNGALGLGCPVTTTAEGCNGVDDDCDGQTDENLSGQPCSLGKGPNCAGLTVCNGLEGGFCDVISPQETCNGIDDDCNSITDDDIDAVGEPCAVTNTFGTCAGLWLCDGKALQCSGGVPKAELCNGKDEDCDGDADEDFTSAGAYLSLQNCGACGIQCPLPVGLHAAATCTAPQASPGCSIGCETGWVDMGGGPQNGCECQYVGPIDQPDGFDQNCDGIDGELANGVFVAKSGADANPGTPQLPVATIGKGIELALKFTKRDVYIGGGVYPGNVDLAVGVSVFGGYGPGYTVRDTVTYQTAIVGLAPAVGPAWTVRCQGISGTGDKTRLDGVTVLAANAKAGSESSYALLSVGCDDRLQVTYCQFLAGDGASGAVGAVGSNGASGAAGQVGLAAKDIGKPSCAAGDANAGGDGGGGACLGQKTDGGSGGSAGCPAMDEDSPSPLCPNKPYLQITKVAELGASGAGAIGGSGGDAGADSYIDSNKGTATQCKGTISCNTCQVPVKPRDGQPGQAGGLATGGTAGGGGQAAAAGVLSNGLWSANSAGSGGGGGDGSGGGGGGAAGGVEVHDCATSTSAYTDIGGSGGGGGGGGCGGSGGGGGQAGGGSFALALIGAADANSPLLFGNIISGGQGGTGGGGGPGGSGGAGGAGGGGGASAEGQQKTFCTSQGGAGGAGSAGGHAGGGGGGAGGPAVLVAVAGFTDVSETALSKTNVFKVSGVGGVGGYGGPAIGNSGKSGQVGVVKTVWKLQ